MSNAVDTLVTRVAADRELMQITSTNIANHDVLGFTRKSAVLSSQTMQEAITGVLLSAINRQVNPLIQSSMINQGGVAENASIESNYYAQLEAIFGNKGQQNSFDHDIGRFANALHAITTDAQPIAKMNAINLANKLVNDIQAMTTQLTVLRTAVDQELGTRISTVNTLVAQIAQNNADISNNYISNLDYVQIMDQRDLAVQELASNFDLATMPGNNFQLSLYTQSGQFLLQGFSQTQMNYTTAGYAGPGVALSPVTIGAVDVTTGISTGAINALINIRDTAIPGIQTQLDEITRNIRDSINAIHNQGTAMTTPNVLVGESGLPGLVSGSGLFSTPLLATTISGNGTVRIGVTDTNGNLISYKDIALGANTTIGALINQVNTANDQNGVAGTFTLSLTGTGALQIAATNPAYGVAITTAGATPAQMNIGAAFTPATTYGFSHFFGMNNLFQTRGFYASSTPQVGIANSLSIRPDIVLNANLLACGTLSTQIPAALNPGVGQGDTTIIQQMINQLKIGTLSFAAGGVFPPTIATIMDYSSRVIDAASFQAATALATHQSAQADYESLATEAYNYSGVDLAVELVNTIEISTSQTITARALQMALDMDKELFEIIR